MEDMGASFADTESLEVHEGEVGSAYARTLDLLARNPGTRKLFLAVISAAREEGLHDSVVSAARKVPMPKSCIQTPEAALSSLVRCGAIIQRIYVNGGLYAGSLETFQQDDCVPVDAEIKYTVQASEGGLNAALAYAPERGIARLFAEKTEYVAVFAEAMRLCASGDGVSRKALEEALKLRLESLGALTSSTPLPIYFIDALEEAGAISWDKAWKLTDEGRTYLDAACLRGE